MLWFLHQIRSKIRVTDVPVLGCSTRPRCPGLPEVQLCTFRLQAPFDELSSVGCLPFATSRTSLSPLEEVQFTVRKQALIDAGIETRVTPCTTRTGFFSCRPMLHANEEGNLKPRAKVCRPNAQQKRKILYVRVGSVSFAQLGELQGMPSMG